jgi:Glycosyltransferases involved in cell wall biogenesis
MKVSVLIPAYNVEKYIEECIESVLTQTMQDFEIICVDDGSTDRTRAILEEYSAKDSRIKILYHEKNQGQSVARNDALDAAKGEYIYMLDADDKIVPELLGDLYEICSRDGLDVVGFETENFTDDPTFESNVRIKTISYSDTDIMDGRRAFTWCIETESLSHSTPTYFIRRDYLKDNNIRYVEGILHEDVGFVFELIVKAEKVRFLHKIYFQRRIRGNSTMTKGFTDKNIEGYLKSFYRSFELEDELMKYPEADDNFRRAFAKYRRDIFGRLNQLYIQAGDGILNSSGGYVDEEIRRAFEIVKILHWRVEKLPITECYLCGTGQYTERAIEAVGAQGIIIRGIIVLDKTAEGFKGFPMITVGEADAKIPVIFSVSRYYKDEYLGALQERGIKPIVIDM